AVDPKLIIDGAILAQHLAAQLVYAGEIVIAADGNIRSGATTYDGDGGWFLGRSSGEPVISLRQGDNFFRFRPSVGYPEFSGVAKLINEPETFTPTWTGFSSAPSGDLSYIDFGSYAMLWATSILTGTSNASTMTITNLPTAIRPSGYRFVGCVVVNNSITVNGAVYYDPLAPATLTFLNTSTFPSAFTASGQKGLREGWLIIYPK